MTYSSNGTEEIKKPENGTRLVYWQEKKRQRKLMPGRIVIKGYKPKISHRRLQTER